MSSIEKQFGYAELKDGTEWEGVRVTFATKVAYERTARANGWNPEVHQFTISAYLSWHAARLSGLTELSWDEFKAQVIDAGLTDEAPEPAESADDDVADGTVGAEATGERPTETAPFMPSPSQSPSDLAFPSPIG